MISILVLAWGCIQIAAFIYFPIRTSVDTAFFVESAQNLLDGHMPQGREWFYISYSALLAGIQYIGLTPESVIYLQMVVQIIAIFSLYFLTRRLNKYRYAPIIAVVLYVLWFKFQQWNLIVYTDALFAHLVVICLYVLIVSKGRVAGILAGSLLIFTGLIRPNGIGLLFAVIAFLLFRLMKKYNLSWRLQLLVWSLFSFGILVVTGFLLTDYADTFIQGYQQAEIIYPDIRFLVSIPQNVYIPGDSNPPLIRLMIFILFNAVYFTKLFLIKTMLFVAHIKPYYSFLHNVYIALFLYPVYYFFIRGFGLMKTDLKILTGAFLLFQVFAVGLTSENWDGRFLLPLLPLLFMVAGQGIAALKVDGRR